MIPGYWHSTYWPEDYWAEDYWTDYGLVFLPLHAVPGYWATTYWPANYFMQDYWPEYQEVILYPAHATPGYWQTTYWPTNYFMDNYWPEYGIPISIPAEDFTYSRIPLMPFVPAEGQYPYETIRLVASLPEGSFDFERIKLVTSIKKAWLWSVITYGSGICFGSGHTFGEPLFAEEEERNFPYEEMKLQIPEVQNGTFEYEQIQAKSPNPSISGDFEYRRF